jgi:hypothetical protein
MYTQELQSPGLHEPAGKLELYTVFRSDKRSELLMTRTT